MTQSLHVQGGIGVIDVEIGAGESVETDLIYEYGPAAQTQVGGVERQDDLGHGAARLGKQVAFVRTQGMLDDQRTIQCRIAEEGRTGIAFVARTGHADLSQVQDTAGRCGFAQIGQIADVAIGAAAARLGIGFPRVHMSLSAFAACKNYENYAAKSLRERMLQPIL